jgi:hypothetical protein
MCIPKAYRSDIIVYEVVAGEDESQVTRRTLGLVTH